MKQDPGPALREPVVQTGRCSHGYGDGRRIQDGTSSSEVRWRSGEPVKVSQELQQKALCARARPERRDGCILIQSHAAGVSGKDEKKIVGQPLEWSHEFMNVWSSKTAEGFLSQATVAVTAREWRGGWQDGGGERLGMRRINSLTVCLPALELKGQKPAKKVIPQ